MKKSLNARGAPNMRVSTHPWEVTRGVPIRENGELDPGRVGAARGANRRAEVQEGGQGGLSVGGLSGPLEFAGGGPGGGPGCARL